VRVLCLMLAAAILAGVPGCQPSAPADVRASAVVSGRVVYVVDNFNDGLDHRLGCCSLYGQKVKSMTERDAQRERRLPCQHCRPGQPG